MQEPNRLKQARTGLYRLVQESNRWWGSWWRIEQALARIEQGDDKVVVTWGSWWRIEQVRTGSYRLEQSCARSEQVMGGHGGESIRLYQACARSEQVVGVMVENRTGSNRLVQDPNREMIRWR